MMNTQTKLKFGIGTLIVLIIALYTYSLLSFKSEYLDGIEYIFRAGIISLFLIPVILTEKFLSPRKKWLALLLNVIITIIGLIVISSVVGKRIKYNAEMLIVSLWPLICYGITKCLNIGNKIGFKPFLIDFIIYNAVMVGLIWFLEEVEFKYSAFSADIIAEFYMYAISVLTFMMYNIKIKKINPDKRDIIYSLLIVGAVIYFWIYNQERITEIIETLNYGKSDVTVDGEYKNWITHRLYMLDVAISGDFSSIIIYRIYSMVIGCSLAWLASVAGWHIPALITILNAVMIYLMVIYARKSNSVLITIAAISFAVKFIVGVTANLFLIFATAVGVPLIRNEYDIIVLAIVFLFCTNNKSKDKHTEIAQQ